MRPVHFDKLDNKAIEAGCSFDVEKLQLLSQRRLELEDMPPRQRCAIHGNSFERAGTTNVTGDEAASSDTRRVTNGKIH